MLALPGYRLDRILRQSTHSTIAQGHRTSDGIAVWVKETVHDSAWLAQSQVEREAAFLSSIAGRGACELIEIATTADGWALVTTAPEGVLLKDWFTHDPLPIAHLLEAASALATMLLGIHAEGIVVRELQPEVIALSSDFSRATLTDLSAAANVWALGEVVQSRPELAQYLSPELIAPPMQPVDGRSDLYALGVLLFQLFSGGHLPFRAQRPQDVLRAHMAYPPARLLELRPGLPETLSAIVEKLLNKNPGERYQSAKGLLNDLLRVDRCLADGDVAQFTPAEHEPPAVPELQHALLGRECECRDFESSLERAAEGKLVVLRLAGETGMGRSRLLHHLHNLCMHKQGRGRNRILFVRCQPDDYNRPGQTLRRLLQLSAELMLLEGAEERSAFRSALETAIGPLLGTLLKFQPRLDTLLPDVPPPPPVATAPHSRQRLLRAITAFFRELLCTDGVHVLMVDDLERADQSSLEWLTYILSELRRGEEPRALLLTTSHPPLSELPASCERVFSQLAEAGAEILSRTLLGLSPAELVRPLMQILGDDDPEHLVACADQLAKRTAGIPTEVHALLGEMIRSSPRWSASLARKLHDDSYTPSWKQIPEAQRHALSAAAVLGMEFPPQLIGALTDQADAPAMSALLPLLDRGLLVRSGRYLRFANDETYFAALQALSSRKNQELHLLAARRLNAQDNAEQLYAICNHYLAAGSLLSGEERLHLANLLYQAGETALFTGGSSEALAYFECGIKQASALASDEARDEVYALKTKLELGKARSLGQLHRDTDSLALFHELKDRSGLPQAVVARTYTALVRFHLRRQELQQAFTAGVEGLRRLGLVAEKRGSAEITATLRELDLAALERAPLTTDPERLARYALHQELAVGISPCATNECGELAVTLLSEAQESERTRDTGYRLLDIAASFCLQGDFEQATRFRQVGQRLLPCMEIPNLRARAEFLDVALIAPHFEPYLAQVPKIQAAIQTALVAGDIDGAHFMRQSEIDLRFIQGDLLYSLRQTIEQTLEDDHSVTGVLACTPLLWRLRALTLLLGDGRHALASDAALSSHLDLDNLRVLEDRVAAATTAHVAWALLLLNRDHQAAALARHSLAMIRPVTPLPCRALAAAVLALTAARFRPASVATNNQRGAPDPREANAEVEAAYRTLCALAERSPNDYLCLLQLVDAERRWSQGDLERALWLFHAAQQDALQHHRAALVALTEERLAAFSLAQGLSTIAARLVRTASQAYDHWGARALSARLREQYAQLLRDQKDLCAQAEEHSGTGKAESGAIAVDNILRLSQEILNETDLHQILERFVAVAIESAQAARGLLLLSRAGVLIVEALGHADHSFERISMPCESYRDAPHSVLTAAVESLRTIEVNDRSSDHPELKADPWFAERKLASVLCCPILRQNRLIGLILLEKSSELPFSGDQRDLVQYVAAQAAVALDNARLYAELSRSNAELEERVEQRTKELQLAKDLAEQARRDAVLATRAKSEFLAAMSHEIRTPMNGVLGMAQLLQGTPLGDEQQEYLRTIRESGEALLSIINDILDLSKIEAGKLDLEAVRFSLRDSLESVGEILAPKAHEKGLELTLLISCDVPDWCVGDPGRLRQVMINLANNAIKFTERGEVCVRVGIEETTQDEFILQIEVIDTGIGISPDRIERLFDAFTQADASTTRRFGGTGLGLTISRRLAEAMGGSLVATSTEGVGSTFTFTAPLGRAEGEALPPLPGTERLHCLVYEPNDHGFFAVVSQLRTAGLHCERLADLSHAIHRLRTTTISVEKTVIFARYPLESDQEGALRSLVESVPVQVVLLATISARPAAEAFRLAGKRAVLTRPLRRMPLRALLSDLLGLPRATPTPGPSLTPDNGHVDRSRFQIMVVEDNRVNQILATRMLKKLGYECTLCGDGRQGLEKATQSSPWHLIFMDCQMPEMDGFEAARRIREHERSHGGHVPIIALTANAMKGDREACLAAGMDDYLSKPIDMQALASMLDRYLLEVDPETAVELGLVSRVKP